MRRPLHPLLLIKRPLEFVVFVCAAILVSFVQADPRLACRLFDVVRPLPSSVVLGLTAIVMAVLFGIVVIVFLPRYLLRRQAMAAALLHFAVFLLGAWAGAVVRIRLAPPAECVMPAAWLPDSDEGFAILILVAVTASLFAAVVNLVSAQKADYSEARQRIVEYLELVGGERAGDIKVLRELLQKARDAVEKARLADPSARYRHALQHGVSEPLSTLVEAAMTTRDDHPEEFLKRIGHRDPGLAPAGAVAAVSRAQRELERMWSHHGP